MPQVFLSSIGYPFELKTRYCYYVGITLEYDTDPNRKSRFLFCVGINTPRSKNLDFAINCDEWETVKEILAQYCDNSDQAYGWVVETIKRGMTRLDGALKCGND